MKNKNTIISIITLMLIFAYTICSEISRDHRIFAKYYAEQKTNKYDYEMEINDGYNSYIVKVKELK